MANLYTGKHKFSGYKTLEELTGLTLESNKTYTIQVYGVCYIREGEVGDGFISTDTKPFSYIYDGVNDLYIGNKYNRSLTINVAG